MSALALAAALALPAAAQRPPAKPGPQGAAPRAGDKAYGVLIMAYDADAAWRRELGSLRALMKGVPVESVESAGDATSVQRALDRLAGQRVDKVVGIPLETITEEPWLNSARYLFGVRAEPATDSPGSASSDAADRPQKKLKPMTASTLKTSSSGAKRLDSRVPLVLAPALDQSPVLAAILADRAKALAQQPARETLVLAGIKPRNDDAGKGWLAAAQAIADKVNLKAGFRKAVAVGVREGVRADQQDKDRADLKLLFRGLVREGRVVVVPLSPQGARVGQMLKNTLGGFAAYRWDGKGIEGDKRLGDWIRSSAEAASKLPDGRQFKDGAR